MENEIEVNGIKYIKADTVKQYPKKNTKGMEYCIVRTYSAGVFAGWINRDIKNQETTVYNARRLWYWDGANSLSELANEGVAKPEKCKFPAEVKEVDLKQIIEVIPCTEKAKQSIANVKVWKNA